MDIILHVLCFQFMLRQEALNLYRAILRSIREVPEEDRATMKIWVREEFELHRAVQDEVSYSTSVCILIMAFLFFFLQTAERTVNVEN